MKALFLGGLEDGRVLEVGDHIQEYHIPVYDPVTLYSEYFGEMVVVPYRSEKYQRISNRHASGYPIFKLITK
jgi:hypothetical protein